MLEIIAQEATSQPTQWVWTNLSPEKITLLIGAYTIGAAALITATYKLSIMSLDAIFGFKNRRLEQEKQLRDLAQATVKLAADPSTPDVGTGLMNAVQDIVEKNAPKTP